MLKKIVFYALFCSFSVCNPVLANYSAITQVNSDKQTKNIAAMLYEAAVEQDAKSVKKILSAGYKIDAVDGNGNTALCLAALAKDEMSVSFLLKHGASKNVRCMRLHKAPSELSKVKHDGPIYLHGGLSDTIYGENVRLEDAGSSFTWTPWIVGGVILGGTGAAIAAGGGGGGSGGASSGPSTPGDEPPPEDIITGEVASCLGGVWETRNGVYLCRCPEGKELKNGACVEKKDEYQTSDIVNDGDIVVNTKADALSVDLGARATNRGSITGSTSDRRVPLMAMSASGFAASAFSGELLPETLLNPNVASRATNEGTITLSQSAISGGRLYGMAGLSGGVVSNKEGGEITLNAQSDEAVYGMFAEFEGNGIVNEGQINLNLSKNVLNAYGIYTDSRGAVNEGNIVLTVSNPNYDSTLAAGSSVDGIYSADAQNTGSILLRRGEQNPTNENNLNISGMHVVKGGIGENLSTGFISLDVTKTPFYTYGIYASQGTRRIVNKGRIELYGKLDQNQQGSDVGGAYGMRFIGGEGTIFNEGEIETRRCIDPEGVCDRDNPEHWENLSITGSAYLGLIRGFAGTIENTADINLFVDNNATSAAKWTIAGIDLEQAGNNGSGVLHKADLDIRVGSGRIQSGTLYGILSGARAENAGNISILNKTNNLDIYGMGGTGSGTNNRYSSILINNEGYNSAVYGLSMDEASNSGNIYITHKGTGYMKGSGGGNTETGEITLIADPLTNSAHFIGALGLGAKGPSENAGKISIDLRKGSCSAISMSDSAEIASISRLATGIALEDSTFTNSGSVSISLTDRTQAFAGVIVGMDAYLSSEAFLAKTRGNVTNSGLLSINANTTIAGTNTPIEAYIIGILSEGGDITNDLNAKIDIDMNGKTQIIGMQTYSYLYDKETVPQLFTATNNGTIEITALNTEHIGGLIVNKLQGGRETLPFDIVGMITNSKAVNNGNILLQVSGDARAAGMVAYDGGMAINGKTGVIKFTGNADNFVALYGSGKRVFSEEEETEGKPETAENGSTKQENTYTKTVTTQYSTVYNWGRIEVNEDMYFKTNPTEEPDKYVAGRGGALLAPVKTDKNAANQIVQSETTTVTITTPAGSTTSTQTSKTEAEEPDISNYVPGTELTDKDSLYFDNVGRLSFSYLNSDETMPVLNKMEIGSDETIDINVTSLVNTDGVRVQNLNFEKDLIGGKSIKINSGADSEYTVLPFNAVGVVTNSYAVNNGRINISVANNIKNQVKAAGMVAYNGGMVVNNGTISFTGNADNFVALYGVGKRVIEISSTATGAVETTTTQYSTVHNNGIIRINNTEIDATTDATADDAYIAGKGGAVEAAIGDERTVANQIVVTAGSSATEDRSNYVATSVQLTDKCSLYADGQCPSEPSQTSSVNSVTTSENKTTSVKTLVLNDGVRYVSEKGGAFFAEGRKVLGSVVGGVSNVLDGNERVYVASGDGSGAVVGNGDASGLELTSDSYLFEASFAQNANNTNGLDLVMTMKSFDDVTSNKSLASFLESNYANGNNEAFFNDIKSIGNATAFTSAMDSLTGRDTIAKFTHEDLTAMREVNFAMNELMFANNDKAMFETNGSLTSFNFKNDNNSSARYALANKRISPRMKIGYAMSTTNLNTEDDNDTTRRNSVFQVFAPISYDRSGIQMISTPQIGFARGHYTRKGYNGTSYEGTIEKRIFALMNEARYPMTVGKFEIAPTVEFNAIAYNTKGSEDEKEYSLTMPSDNSLSVEAGLGIYAKRVIGNMKFNAGLMVYREFADPYNIKMGMNGMEGTFELYDDRSEYRGVASFGFGYDVGKLNVYGNIQHFMETDTNTKVKAGLKFGF